MTADWFSFEEVYRKEDNWGYPSWVKSSFNADLRSVVCRLTVSSSVDEAVRWVLSDGSVYIGR